MGSRRSGVLLTALLVVTCNLAEGQTALRGAGGTEGTNPPQQLTDADRQKKTITDIRNLGTALFAWLTDQAGAAAAGQMVNVEDYPAITEADLEKLLVPSYIGEIPKRDGWGHPYEVRLNVKDVTSKQVISIRSPGRDGKFSGSTYTVGAFAPQDYDQDIAWVDGYFLRWPEKK